MQCMGQNCEIKHEKRKKLLSVSFISPPVTFVYCSAALWLDESMWQWGKNNKVHWRFSSWLKVKEWKAVGQWNHSLEMLLLMAAAVSLFIFWLHSSSSSDTQKHIWCCSWMVSSLLYMAQSVVPWFRIILIHYELKHTVNVQLLCPVSCPLPAQIVSSGRF